MFNVPENPIKSANHLHKPEIGRTQHHEEVDNCMSRIDTSDVGAALSEAESQDVVIQS